MKSWAVVMKGSNRVRVGTVGAVTLAETDFGEREAGAPAAGFDCGICSSATLEALALGAARRTGLVAEF